MQTVLHNRTSQALSALSLLLISVFSGTQALAADDLNSLPATAQEEVRRICLPVQYREGAAAYRNCVQAEVSSRGNNTKTDLAILNFDEKYAVQQACASAGASSAENYERCVSDQVRQMQNIPAPVLTSLNDDERYAIQQTCFTAQSKQGVAAYRTCMNTQLESLEGVPSVDTSDLSMLEKNALQLRCSANSRDVVNYRRCLAAEFESITGNVPTYSTALKTLTNSPQVEPTAEPVSAVVAEKAIVEPVAEPSVDITRAVDNTAPVSNGTSTLTEQVANGTALEPDAESSPELEAEVFDNLVTVNAEALEDALTEDVATPTNTPVTAATKTETNTLDAAADPAQSSAQAPQPADESIQIAAPAAALPAQTASETALPENTLAQATVALAKSTTPNSGIESDTVFRQALPRNIEPQLADSNRADENAVLALNETVAANAVANDADDQSAIRESNDTAGVAQQTVASGNSQAATAAAEQTEPSPTGNNLALLSLQQKFNSLMASTEEKIANLDNSAWILIGGLFALPAIILALLSISRRFSPINAEDYADFEANEASANEGLKTRQRRQEEEAKSLFEDLENTHADPDLHASADAVNTETASAITPMEQPSSEIALDVQGDEEERTAKAVAYADLATRKQANTSPPPPSVTPHWQSGFAAWVQQHSADDQLHLCIDFLIYWMAYGDDRYQPELKKRLFTARDLSQFDEVKRWVLKQDTQAFADVVCMMQTQTNREQREQTLSLLMALLISEHSVTPVQNTLLRFLADAFGVRKHALESNFEKSFGHELPSMPRVDKTRWWEKQHASEMQLWDSRAMLAQPEKVQLLARFGLAENPEDTDVIQAFRRAALRCHPDRFSSLGERQKTLAAQRFTKFEEARDKLLGVSV